MTRFNEKTPLSVQAILDLTIVLKGILGDLESVVAAMNEEELQEITTKNERSGRDGLAAFVKFCSAIREGFGNTIANRSISSVLEKKASYAIKPVQELQDTIGETDKRRKRK